MRDEVRGIPGVGPEVKRAVSAGIDYFENAGFDTWATDIMVAGVFDMSNGSQCAIATVTGHHFSTAAPRAAVRCGFEVSATTVRRHSNRPWADLYDLWHDAEAIDLAYLELNLAWREAARVAVMR